MPSQVRPEEGEQYIADANGKPTIIYSPSLSYKKEFWGKRHYDETQYTLESFYFLKGRLNKVMEIPYSFVMYAMHWDIHSHTMNELSRYGIKGKASISNRSAIGSTSSDGSNTLSEANNSLQIKGTTDLNFIQQWDTNTQNMILMLGQILKNDKEI